MSGIRKLGPGSMRLALCFLSVATVGAVENTIPAGTKITLKNWQQFKAFMPDGMIALFDGSVDWKMPPDVEMDVGPTTIHPLPKPFWDAVEKYSTQTQFIKFPTGASNFDTTV